MFFFAAVTVVIMALMKIFTPKKYTKPINWDVLITIACAIGISKALQNSGAADVIAHSTINISRAIWPCRCYGCHLHPHQHLYRNHHQQRSCSHYLSQLPMPQPPSLELIQDLSLSPSASLHPPAFQPPSAIKPTSLSRALAITNSAITGKSVCP